MVRHLRFKACAGLLAATFVGALLAAPAPRPTVAVPPPTDPSATQATSRPAWPAIPAETLDEMYKAELGERFRPQMLPAYRKAHELIESYFETPGRPARAAIVKQLEGTELDPTIIGRLCRVRTYWPQLDAGGVYYVNEKVGVFPTRYFFGLPKTYDRAKAWPLVIKLPTAHAFLTEPPPTADQVTQIYTKWIKEELDAHPDAVVLMPLLNLDELWGPSYGGMAAVTQPMQHVASRVNLDPAKVYLVGHGMSGHAAWNLGLHYPTYFAAFNALAGGAGAGFQRLRVIGLRNVLPVAWVDAEDQPAAVDATRGIVNALRKQKVNVESEETKGLGHVPDAATVERQYGKMRARVRELYPPSVAIQSDRPDAAFNRSDWVQVYQPINPGEERRATFGRGTGVMRTNSNPHSVDATRKPNNRIEITTRNVDTLRLYLNDQMVDLSKPITVTVNGVARFVGMAKQSVDEMMKDQVFLGRGWRYHTAVIDLELFPRTPAPTRPSTTQATTRPVTRPATAPATRPR